MKNYTEPGTYNRSGVCRTAGWLQSVNEVNVEITLENQSRAVNTGESQNSSQTKTDETIRTARANNRQKWGEYIMIRQKLQ